MADPLDVGKVSNHLKLVPVYVEEIALIASAEEDMDRPFDDLRVIEALPLVTYDEGEYVFGVWFQELYGTQPTTTSSVHHFEELEEVVEMVALGRGFSVVPLDAAQRALDEGRVQVVRPGGRNCFNRAYLVLRAGAFVRQELHELVQALRKASSAPIE
jgi:DNA-binding transcriptional LysR family regulator